MVKSAAASKLQIDIAQKYDSENKKMHIKYKSNFPVRIYNVLCNVRVPKAWLNATLKTENGEVIEIKKEKDGEEYIYYKFNMENLVSFTIGHE